MICVNCDKDAVWIFQTSGIRDTPYCNPHLPAAYRGTKFVIPVEAAPEPAPVDPGPEPVLEDPKPKRTRKPKKVAEPDPAAEDFTYEGAPAE